MKITYATGAGLTYRIDTYFKTALKRLPEIAEARRGMAQTLRLIRRDNRPMARLLRQRMKDAENALRNRIWGQA